MLSASIVLSLILLSPVLLAAPIAVYWLTNQDAHRAKPLIYLAVIGLAISALSATYMALAYPMKTLTFSYPWITIPPSAGGFNGIEITVSFVVDFLSRFMGLLTAWLAFI
jgi:hypothetical protein